MKGDLAIRALLLRQCAELAAARAQRHFAMTVGLGVAAAIFPALLAAALPLAVLTFCLAVWAMIDARSADEAARRIQEPLPPSLPRRPPIPSPWMPPSAEAPPIGPISWIQKSTQP